MAIRLPAIAALTNIEELAQLFGPITDVRVIPLTVPGFSGARHSRVEIFATDARTHSAVLKEVRLDRDWLARRSGDTVGREVALLEEDSLLDVGAWLRSAALAFAVEPGAFGLLMVDLASDLLPDQRAPLRDEQEYALIASLARLHARFWRDPALDRIPWLAHPHHYADLLAPSILDDDAALALMIPAHRERVVQGWTLARQLLPARDFALLAEPGTEFAARGADLPTTLLHGDVKVANFALPPGGRVVAFDWAMAGVGPCALDVGWYLAVNATRLTGSKEALIARYRGALENALDEAIAHATWHRMVQLGIVYGARALLWSKALGYQSGSEQGRLEWDWWAAHLAAIERV